jgi:hypothetical protein
MFTLRVHPLDVHPRLLEAHEQASELGVRLLELGVHALDLGVHALDLGVHALEPGVHVLELGVHVLELGVHVPDLGVHMPDIAVHQRRSHVFLSISCNTWSESLTSLIILLDTVRNLARIRAASILTKRLSPFWALSTLLDPTVDREAKPPSP